MMLTTSPVLYRWRVVSQSAFLQQNWPYKGSWSDKHKWLTHSYWPLTHTDVGPKIKCCHPSPSFLSWVPGKLSLLFITTGKKKTRLKCCCNFESDTEGTKSRHTILKTLSKLSICRRLVATFGRLMWFRMSWEQFPACCHPAIKFLLRRCRIPSCTQFPMHFLTPLLFPYLQQACIDSLLFKTK